MKIHDHIDQLLLDRKEKEAIPLIEEVWGKEARARKEMIADLNRRLDALEKRKETIRRNNLPSEGSRLNNGAK